ncbi:GDSL-type esterase/lipase family protein [Agromyces archimandritae]|uniref:SGNH hydrolase-type esterase domain-containing protein n=1 Tax=Agromyces archimandritae TaxID=2781962 RepID=A0A975FR04_9MICO|nr:GDSL-type esterase/lipase family protein [Agromyces archimandritae]QTX05626.1 hypothetical protein G127AT_05320 [Agromyces archimandritae]
MVKAKQSKRFGMIGAAVGAVMIVALTIPAGAANATGSDAAGTAQAATGAAVDAASTATGTDALTADAARAAVPTGVVTLGDSFSSGLGSGGYYNDCDNTANAWGNLIFGSSVTNRSLIACSGATMPTVRAQLASIPTGSGRLITVTVGGNDMGFANELKDCFLSNCTDREATLTAKISALVGPLTQLYREIRSATPNDRLIVGGYPLLVPDPGVQSSCSALTFLLTSAERQMVRRLGVQLNDAIDRAAAAAGVPAVTTALETRFAGHEACKNSTSWINGLKITLWSSVDGVDRLTNEAEEVYIEPQAEIVAGWIRDSFHPNGPGQTAYAAAFQAAY